MGAYQVLPGSNANEGVLHTSQSSRTGASPPDAIQCYTLGIAIYK